MSTAEARLATKLKAIEEALEQALGEAAGEPMAYILLITPTGRVGEHILTSNIIQHSVIMKFMSDARIQLRNKWKKAGHRFADLRKKGLDS